MSNQCNSTHSATEGRGPELKYEFYFPPNSCMPKDNGFMPGKCPKYPYPLTNIPTCSSIYVPCTSSAPVDTTIYGTNPAPSELYGDTLAMDGGDGLFYYHNPYSSDMSLTYSKNQPYHFARTSY